MNTLQRLTKYSQKVGWDMHTELYVLAKFIDSLDMQEQLEACLVELVELDKQLASEPSEE